MASRGGIDMGTPKYGQYLVPPPEIFVNFGVGQPSPAMLEPSLRALRQSSAAKLAEDDPLFLQYGFISGYPAFRETLASFLTPKYGLDVKPDNLFVTNGISGTMSAVCNIFARRGDTVYVEEPSYFLALSIFKEHGLNLVGIKMDEQGMIVEDLAAKLKTNPKPAFVYTVPVFHNPSGRTLSAARREQLVELSKEHNFLIVADEVYHMLSFPGGADAGLKAMPAYDKYGTILSLGSFSKIMAPAVRLGWIHADPALLSKFINAAEYDSAGGHCPLVQGIMEATIKSGLQEQQLNHCREHLSAGATALCDALDQHLPKEVTYTRPGGGYFIWLKLPEGVDALGLLEEAKTNFKVGFLPGTRLGSGLESYFRLSVSYYDAAGLAEGAARIGNAIRAYMALKKQKTSA